jgi:hypothetical protein
MYEFVLKATVGFRLMALIWWRELQIPPRHAPRHAGAGGMTKGRVAVSTGVSVAGIPGLKSETWDPFDFFLRPSFTLRPSSTL